MGKIETPAIRQRMLMVLNQVDKGLAAQVAYGLGMHIPETPELINLSIPADADPLSYQPVKKEGSLTESPALSMANTIKDSIRTRKIAILAADGVMEAELTNVKNLLLAQGAMVDVIAPRLGTIAGANGTKITVDKSLLTVASVLYDAVYVPGGANSVATLEAEADAIHFLNEAYKHCKAIAATGDALQVLEATYFAKKLPEDNSDATVMREGVIIGTDAGNVAKQFIAAIAQHRFWEREKPRKIPA